MTMYSMTPCRIPACVIVIAAVVGAVGPISAIGQSIPASLVRAGGTRFDGQLVGDTRSGYRLAPGNGAPEVVLQPGDVLQFARDANAEARIAQAPFRFRIGEALRISGVPREVNAMGALILSSCRAGVLKLPRPGLSSIEQRPGESRVWSENFGSLDKERWTIESAATVSGAPGRDERKSLRLPATGASIARKLDQPLDAGRLELDFFENGTTASSSQWSIDLSFRGPAGETMIRVIPGWSEESLAVESPGGPALQVQRLVRSTGWHHLSLRFGPDQTEIAVDGKELAHGKGSNGQLESVRLRAATTGQANPPPELSGHVTDLELTRFTEPPVGLESDASQDEARLVVGDQIYGRIDRADGESIAMTVEGKPVALAWGDVAGLYFRRQPAQANPTEGLHVRLDWRSGPGESAADIDFAEGTLDSLSKGVIELSTPYAGVLAIPVDRLRKLIILGSATRLVIDPAIHHLGDEVSVSEPVLDPPLPEGATLERTFNLAAVPERPAFVVMDVVQVVGENTDSTYSESIKNGELRTYVSVNGKRLDYLNRHIQSQNESAERIATAIPPGLLHVGENSVRITLTGMAGNPNQLDDLGILQIAIEFTTTPTRSPATPELTAR
jgi:hypothetical protein